MSDEAQVAYRIKHYLDLGAEELDPAIARRLRLARGKALDRVPVSAARLHLAGFGHFHVDGFWPALRSVVGLLVVALGVAALSYWSELDQVAETEEVDTALLADELPINAYLDRGFDAWLKTSSPD
jgi:hypothetical protein